MKHMDPKLVGEIMGMAESGMIPQEIASKLIADHGVDEPKDEEITELEDFPDGIRMIAQAFAYRKPTKDDYEEIKALFMESYKDEVEGDFAFRHPPAVAPVQFDELFACVLDPKSVPQGTPPPYQWLVAEAPNGYDIERDGLILGCCCYTTDGLAKCNGVVEGHCGGIRLFGILRRYRKLCIGRRLLDRVELIMMHSGSTTSNPNAMDTKSPLANRKLTLINGGHHCIRSMICLPFNEVEEEELKKHRGKGRGSPGGHLTSIHDWVERRGYLFAGAVPYPGNIGHRLRVRACTTPVAAAATATAASASASASPSASAATMGARKLEVSGSSGSTMVGGGGGAGAAGGEVGGCSGSWGNDDDEEEDDATAVVVEEGEPDGLINMKLYIYLKKLTPGEVGPSSAGAGAGADIASNASVADNKTKSDEEELRAVVKLSLKSTTVNTSSSTSATATASTDADPDGGVTAANTAINAATPGSAGGDEHALAEARRKKLHLPPHWRPELPQVPGGAEAGAAPMPPTVSFIGVDSPSGSGLGAGSATTTGRVEDDPASSKQPRGTTDDYTDAVL